MIFIYILRRLKSGFGQPLLLLSCTPMLSCESKNGGNAGTGVKHDMGDAVDTKLHKSKIAGPPSTGYIAAYCPDVQEFEKFCCKIHIR